MDPDNLLQGNIKDVRSLKPTSFQQTIPERDALKAFFFFNYSIQRIEQKESIIF